LRRAGSRVDIMLNALHILASALMAADHKELIRPEEERLPKKYPLAPKICHPQPCLRGSLS